MMCECGATIIPYRRRVFSWCTACGKAYNKDSNRVPFKDVESGQMGYERNDDAYCAAILSGDKP